MILTDMVVRANQWARDLQSRLRVHVVGGLAELDEVLDAVCREESAVEEAGAPYVTALVLARWLRPGYGENVAFIRTRLTHDFDPARCPWTHGVCPP